MIVSRRILDAITLLDPQPGEELFEIGCGTGQAIEALLTRAPDARIDAIDRSEKAVARALVVNRDAVERGRVTITIGDIEQGPATRQPRRRGFAIRVNTFWTRPGLAIPHLAASLLPGGELWILYDTREAKIEQPIKRSFTAAGWSIRRVSGPGAFGLVCSR